MEFCTKHHPPLLAFYLQVKAKREKSRKKVSFSSSIALHPMNISRWKWKKKKRKEIKKLILLLVPAKVNFVEMPTDTSVPVGTEAMLKCVTSSRVEKCTWFWKPLHGNEPEIVIEEYPSNGDLGRDCSFTFPKVYIEKQGQWACQVSIGSLNTILTSPYAKLTVFEQGIFIFVNVLQFPPPLVQGNGETFSLLFLLFRSSSIFNNFQYFSISRRREILRVV